MVPTSLTNQSPNPLQTLLGLNLESEILSILESGGKQAFVYYRGEVEEGLVLT